MIVAALIVLLLLVPGSAHARVGELDPAFGEGGRVFAPFKGTSLPMATGRDGSIVFLTGGDVGRLLPNGLLDPGFSQGGIARLEDFDGLPFTPFDVAVDSQGRVLVFGTTSDPSHSVDPSLMYVPPVQASWATVIRLDAGGRLDPSFGEGRGFARNDLGLPATFAPDLPTLRVTTGDVDSQDRPIFVASEAEVYSPCYGHTGVAWLPRAIARLTASGALDTAFGDDGVSPLADLREFPTLSLDGAGGPVVAGGRRGCRNGIFVDRLGADGAPLAGFGVGGVRLYRGAWSFSAIDPSGAMILQRGRPTTHVLQVQPDGEPDQSFGRRGWTAVTPPTGATTAFRPVAVDAWGRILLAGSFKLPKPEEGSQGKHRRKARRRTRNFFVVSRLLRSGKPDLGFGKRGAIVTPLNWLAEVAADQAVLDSQGRLVIAGAARKHGSSAGLLLRRYLLGP